MVVWKSLIRAITAEISSMAVTAPPVSVWMACTRREMSSVARAVSWARSLTSDATTAKPATGGQVRLDAGRGNHSPWVRRAAPACPRLSRPAMSSGDWRGQVRSPQEDDR
jgi:hypothetical protein